MRYALKEKYPIETSDQLEKTAAYFDRYLSRFHPKERMEFATAIEKRATDLHVSLSYPWITNYSRPVLCKSSISPDFERNMDLRKHACLNKMIVVDSKEVKANDLIDKIKDSVTKQSSYTTVDAVFEFDKLAGLEYQWDKAILDPIMTVFGSLNNPKFDSEVIIGNLTENDLKKIAADKGEIEELKGMFQEHLIRKFIENPKKAIAALNPIEKEAFLKIVKK